MRSIFSSRWRVRARGAATTALLACACVWLLPAAAGAKPLAPLKLGSGGPRVAALQLALGLPSDRVFGPATRRALQRFQRRHGITADGVVGPATWALVKRVRARQRGAGRSRSSNARSRTTRRGSAAPARRTPARSTRPRVRHRGSEVRLLQRGLGMSPDGVYGPATARAVRRLQRRHKMTVDGIVGPATWALLGNHTTSAILRERPAAVSGPAFAGLPLRVRRVIASANKIAGKPYRYGGGHGRWYDSGYDCSGSISFALWGAGLLRTSLDSGRFMRWGRSGRGRYITVYASPGHAFMVVAGRRFDTSGARANGTRWQSSMRSTSGYVARHPPGL